MCPTSVVWSSASTLLYPPDGDVAGAIERAAGIVRPNAIVNAG